MDGDRLLVLGAPVAPAAVVGAGVVVVVVLDLDAVGAVVVVVVDGVAGVGVGVEGARRRGGRRRTRAAGALLLDGRALIGRGAVPTGVEDAVGDQLDAVAGEGPEEGVAPDERYMEAML